MKSFYRHTVAEPMFVCPTHQGAAASLQLRLRSFLGFFLEKQSFHFLVRRVILARGQVFLVQPCADPLLEFVVSAIQMCVCVCVPSKCSPFASRHNRAAIACYLSHRKLRHHNSLNAC